MIITGGLLMPFIEWSSDKFSVGIDEIDEQHKKWIELINKLHNSLIAHDSSMSQEQAIKEMMDYTRFHFNHEEKIMRDVQYPGYEKHKTEHELFILKIEKLEQDISKGSFVLKTRIMSILKHWLEEHICAADKDYGAFISNSIPVLQDKAKPVLSKASQTKPPQ